MLFETTGVTETGLQMIDEAIREAFKSLLPKRPLTSWNPRWSFRKINNFHEGNGAFVIGVEGEARLHTCTGIRRICVKAEARILRKRGCRFPISVTGTCAEEPPSPGCEEPPKHPFEKTVFPSDW